MVGAAGAWVCRLDCALFDGVVRCWVLCIYLSCGWRSRVLRGVAVLLSLARGGFFSWVSPVVAWVGFGLGCTVFAFVKLANASLGWVV